jgi:hypothetical protein
MKLLFFWDNFKNQGEKIEQVLKDNRMEDFDLLQPGGFRLCDITV